MKQSENHIRAEIREILTEIERVERERIDRRGDGRPDPHLDHLLALLERYARLEERLNPVVEPV